MTAEPKLSDILRKAADSIPCLRQPRRPLAIGLGPVLAARIAESTGCDLQTATYAISRHTTGDGYLRGCREGTARVDLDGQPVGAVTAAEAMWAAERLAKSERRQAARKAATAAATPAAPQVKVNPVTGRRILTLSRATV